MKISKSDQNTFVKMLIACPCIIVLVWSLIDFTGISISDNVITLIFELIVLAFAIVFSRRSKISLLEFGLRIKNPKKTLGEGFAIAFFLIVVGIIGKLAVMKLDPDFFPADAPFFRWRSRSLLGYFYVVTCLIQEFLARGCVQELLNATIEGKHKTLTVLGLLALILSVFHIHLGFVFMVCAGCLMAILGILYERHKNIWGVLIVHYLVGYTYIHLFIPA